MSEETRTAQSPDTCVREALEHYADQYCEGWCKDAPAKAHFDDCGGCKARLAIAALPQPGAVEPTPTKADFAKWSRVWNNTCNTMLEMLGLPGHGSPDEMIAQLGAYLEGRAPKSPALDPATVEACAKVAHDRRKQHNDALALSGADFTVTRESEAQIIEQSIRALLASGASNADTSTVPTLDDADKLRKISDLITELQAVKERFGDTCVYIRRGGLSWGAVALNRRDDDNKHGVFDLQAQHDRDMLQRAEQVERLIADKNRWMERAMKAEENPVPSDWPGKVMSEKQPRMIPNPLYCDSCEGRGYLVADAEWEPYAIQCPDCADRKPPNPASQTHTAGAKNDGSL